MGRFIRGVGQTRRLVLEGTPGDWVEYKTKFSMTDRAKITEAIMGGDVSTEEVEVKDATGQPIVDPKTGRPRTETRVNMGQLSVAASNITTLKVALVDWGGPGFCVRSDEHDSEDGAAPHSETGAAGCKKVPLNDDYIGSLDEDTGNAILTAIREANPTPKEDSTNP